MGEMIDIFRFVTVRAPQRIAGDPKARVLLYAPDRPNGLEFHNILIRLFQEAFNGVRPTVLPEKPVLRIYKSANSWLQQNRPRLDDEYYSIRIRLEQLYTEALAIHSNESLRDIHAALKEKIDSVFELEPGKLLSGGQLSGFHEFLWNMLYATFSTSAANARDIDVIITCLRSLALIGAMEKPRPSIDGNSLQALLIATPVLPDNIFPITVHSGAIRDIPSGEPLPEDSHTDPSLPNLRIRPLGIADLRIVRQSLARYEMGEITHIENVLQTEKRERRHRYLNRTEESFTTEKETETEEERNLQTTDRLELQRESAKTIQENFDVNAGVTVTYSGPVSVSANAGFSYSRAQSESVREASNLAKEIINQTQKKIVERVREERTRKTTEEIEEINSHVFDNTGADAKDVSGIYRWVDKIYKCQLFNYGKRLMFELIVPEPAAFYKYNLQSASSSIKKPKDLPASFTPAKITALDAVIETKEGIDVTVADLIKEYGVTGVTPFPQDIITLGTTIKPQEENGGDWGVLRLEAKDIKVQDGYMATGGFVHFSFHKSQKGPSSIAWSVGQASGLESLEEVTATPKDAGTLTLRNSIEANDDYSNSNQLIQFSRKFSFMPPESGGSESGQIAVSVSSMGTANLVVGVQVTATPSTGAIQKWRLSVYEKITQQYSILYSEYEQKKAREEIRNQTISNPAGGANPLINKQTIEDELKKHCITLLTGWQFEGFDAMKYFEDEAPRINVEEAIKEGPIIRFFEQAFEWDRITYVFYPYFWGRKSRWEETLRQNSDDPLFKSFLRAGAARIVLPVASGLTEAILWYIKTGELRIASAMPAVNRDIEYLSIVDEIHGQPDEIDGGVEEGRPWEVKIPTNLVILNSQGSQLESIP